MWEGDSQGFSDIPKVTQLVDGQKSRDLTLNLGAPSATTALKILKLVWREQGCCPQSTEPKANRKAIFIYIDRAVMCYDTGQEEREVEALPLPPNQEEADVLVV